LVKASAVSPVTPLIGVSVVTAPVAGSIRRFWLVSVTTRINPLTGSKSMSTLPTSGDGNGESVAGCACAVKGSMV
jgi:hypothetical protein